MSLYLEAKHLDDLLKFGWNIIVENTSNLASAVMLPSGRYPFAGFASGYRIYANDVVDITEIKNSTEGMRALRVFLGRGVLTLINENSWDHEEFDNKNRRRAAILAQRERNKNG